MGRSKLATILDESGNPAFGEGYRFSPGKAEWLRRGADAAIIACGAPVHEALKAAEDLAKIHGVHAAVLNCASLRPIDVESVEKAADTGLIVTVEDHHAATGLGSIVAETLTEKGLPCRLVRLGVKKYGFSATPAELYSAQGIDREGIVRAVLQARTATR